MGSVLFLWIFLGILIKEAGSMEIDNLQSGSKSCDMTLGFNPSGVLFTGYRSLEVFKPANSRSDHSMVDCNVLSVRLLRGSGRESTLKSNMLSDVVTKRHNPSKMILQHRDFKRLPADGVYVLVELDCKGRRCFLHSADGVKKKNIIESSWMVHRRKLLSIKSGNDPRNRQFSVVAPLVVAIAGIIVLVVALAMCSCGNNSHEKALSNEVGGADCNPHVVGVSTIKIKEETNDNSTESKKIEETVQRNSQTLTKNGEVNATGRTASQSSQPEKQSVGGGELRPRSSGSHNSVDKVNEVELSQRAPEKAPDTTGYVEKDRKRTGSEKEVPLAENVSKENNSSNEARTRTDSSEGVKKGLFRIPSRKRMGSDGKEPKSSPEEHEENKTKFWQRRKSSKTNADTELTENPSPKKEKEKEKEKKKKKSKKNHTPEHVPSSTRTANQPLPPTPSPDFVEEDTHYEVVESRSRKRTTSTEANYESVTTSKSKSYDKVNVILNDQTRPASELYECINDEDAKMKRVSSGSNQYDVVETRSPPKKAPVTLEYAYSVVASRDTIQIPTETSGSSGLYEVVTDDIKQQSGVLDAGKPDVEVEDDYAVVQKDPSKKRGSKNDADELHSQADKQKKSISGEIDPAPAPPPVSSLIHAVSSSVRRRTQSEGDEMNAVERSDYPVDSTSPSSERPQTMFEADQTYATVDMSMKKRYSVEATHSTHEFDPAREFAPASALPEGFYEDSDTPPPIPPSLYADLESTRRKDDEENKPTSSPNAEPRKDDDENAYEEVATAKVQIKSITSTPIVTDVTKSKETSEVKQERPMSPRDPNGVLGRLRPPSGSPRNSQARHSGTSIDGENRHSSGSQDNYNEVIKTTQAERSSSSPRSSKELGVHVRVGNESKRNSSNQDGNDSYDGVNEKEKSKTAETDDKIVTYV